MRGSRQDLHINNLHPTAHRVLNIDKATISALCGGPRCRCHRDHQGSRLHASARGARTATTGDLAENGQQQQPGSAGHLGDDTRACSGALASGGALGGDPPVLISRGRRSYLRNVFTVSANFLSAACTIRSGPGQGFYPHQGQGIGRLNIPAEVASVTSVGGTPPPLCCRCRRPCRDGGPRP